MEGPPDGSAVWMMSVLVPDGFGDDLEKVLSLRVLLIGERLLQDVVDGTDVEAFEDSTFRLFRPFVTDKNVRHGNGRSFEVILSQNVDHFVTEFVDVLRTIFLLRLFEKASPFGLRISFFIFL